MKTKIIHVLSCILFFISTAFCQSTAISSVLMNFGTNNCGDIYNSTFSAIGNPMTAPYLISNCAVNPPFSSISNKYIAYNPKDNKIYINDVNSGDSRLYIYNMGLPTAFTCPAVMPATPTYNYGYVPNNFEFDINGDVWSIRSLSGANAIIERFDEATGTILFTKILNFPPGHVPNTLGSGDIVILPNGRMFLVFGNTPSMFFEVTNYISGAGNATANYIQDMSAPCYGILYVNGNIELTGTNFGGNCYKYIYDISSGTVGPQSGFQLNMTPIDNTSVSPSIGAAKKLVGSSNVDSVTENIVYEIYTKNIGNVKLHDFNVLEDLGAVFGAANVSNVSVSFIPGYNPGGLTLNPSFNGTTNIEIFNSNQTLSNLTNGYAGFRVSLRATNLIPNTVYYNTAKSRGEIGSGATKIVVIDSSNNGGISAMDPNLDGDAGDVNENNPTPYFFGRILPVKFISVTAVKTENSLHTVNWTIASTSVPLSKFIIEYSEDQLSWQTVGTAAAQASKNTYSFSYNNSSPNNAYYRIRAFESSGKDYLSTEVVIKRTEDDKMIKISPNPADEFAGVYDGDENIPEGRRIYITDVSGKKIYDQPYIKKYTEISTSQYPNGYYIINIADKTKIFSTQLLVKHK